MINAPGFPGSPPGPPLPPDSGPRAPRKIEPGKDVLFASPTTRLPGRQARGPGGPGGVPWGFRGGPVPPTTPRESPGHLFSQDICDSLKTKKIQDNTINPHSRLRAESGRPKKKTPRAIKSNWTGSRTPPGNLQGPRTSPTKDSSINKPFSLLASDTCYPSEGGLRQGRVRQQQ